MVTMRVGGRYRLRNGEVWTCDDEYGGGEYRIARDAVEEGKFCCAWVNDRGSIYNDGMRHQHDVIAEVTDDAVSEPQHVKPDDVNHPKHYTSHPSGVECIDITEAFSFNLGNAIKYIWRAGLKSPDAAEDLRKAAWYVNREIKRIEAKQ